MISASTHIYFGSDKKLYTLINKDGEPYNSSEPGKHGGNKSLKIYGKLDCPSAVKWISKGHYIKHRVFFADEKVAVQAGYRPCGICLKSEYNEWKQNPDAFKQRKLSILA